MTGPPVRQVVRSVRTRHRMSVFVAASLVVLVVIGIATVLIAQLLARRETLHTAEQSTARLAQLVVAPLLADALAGDVQRRDELDRAVAVRLADGNVAEINIWRADGTIVYADRPVVDGIRLEVPEQVTAAIDRGETASDIDVTDEAGQLPRGTPVVEVYVPLQVAGLPRLAFEVYYTTEEIDRRTSELATELLLLGLVPLVTLQLVQIPIAASLSRRVGRQEAERTALLARALSASDHERRTIASDLHDGVVQELAGVGYALGALIPAVAESARPVAETCAATVRSAVDGLRRLMADIYPPELTGSGLSAAIDNLAGPLRLQGTPVQIEVGALPEIDTEVAGVLYRVARESLVNVAKHARATHVRVELGPDPGGPGIQLRVVDDGVGPGPDALVRRSDGHFGLTMLRDRVEDMGGRFVVQPGPDGGTVADAVLPAVLPAAVP